MDSAFKILHFLKIVVNGLLLNLQSCGGGLGIFKLTLLEFKIILHLVDLRRSWQFVLSCHISLHMLEESGDQSLMLLDLLFVLSFLNLELLSESIDFLFLLIQDLILLLLSTLCVFFSKVLLNLLNILLIGIDHLLHFDNFFIHLLDFGIVLLDTVLESLSSLWQREVHLIGLEFQILLLLSEHGSLLLQMLCSLLESILSKS